MHPALYCLYFQFAASRLVLRPFHDGFWIFWKPSLFARSFVVRRTPGSFLGPKWSRYGNKTRPQDVLIEALPDTRYRRQ